MMRVQGAGRFPEPWDVVSYRGTYFQGLAEGAGTIAFANGAVYTGEVHKGRAHGDGTLVWPDRPQDAAASSPARRYEGTFRDGRFDRVTARWDDGRVITGQWDAVGLEWGTVCWPDGARYVGAIYFQQPSGDGKFTWPNGDTLTAHFSGWELKSPGWLCIGGKTYRCLPDGPSVVTYRPHLLGRKRRVVLDDRSLPTYRLGAGPVVATPPAPRPPSPQRSSTSALPGR
jgi:hypothetical protein